MRRTDELLGKDRKSMKDIMASLVVKVRWLVPAGKAGCPHRLLPAPLPCMRSAPACRCRRRPCPGSP